MNEFREWFMAVDRRFARKMDAFVNASPKRAQAEQCRYGETSFRALLPARSLRRRAPQSVPRRASRGLEPRPSGRRRSKGNLRSAPIRSKSERAARSLPDIVLLPG